MALPESMSYVAVDGAGAPEVMHLAQASLPVTLGDSVLIRVLAAGVNRPDVSQRQGFYPPPPDASPILGLEVAGEVVVCGPEVVRWKPGDRVCALVNGGGYAGPAWLPRCSACPGRRDTTRSGLRRCRKPTSLSGPTCSRSAG